MIEATQQLTMLRIAIYVCFTMVVAAATSDPAAATSDPAETDDDFTALSRYSNSGYCVCESRRGGTCSIDRRNNYGRDDCRPGYQPICGGSGNFGICYCLCKPVPACPRDRMVPVGGDCLCGSSGEETNQICSAGSTCTMANGVGVCALQPCTVAGRQLIPDGGDCRCGAGPRDCRAGSTCDPTLAISDCIFPSCTAVEVDTDCMCGTTPPNTHCEKGSQCVGFNRGPSARCILPECKEGVVAKSCRCGNTNSCNPGDDCISGFCVRQVCARDGATDCFCGTSAGNDLAAGVCTSPDVCRTILPTGTCDHPTIPLAARNTAFLACTANPADRQTVPNGCWCAGVGAGLGTSGELCPLDDMCDGRMLSDPKCTPP